MSFPVAPSFPLSMAKGLHKSPNFSGTVLQKTAAGIGSAVSLKPYATWDFEFGMDSVQGNESAASSVVALFFSLLGATMGGANLFLFTDPQDHSVTNMHFGTGNGTTTAFQLSREIGSPVMVDVIQNVNGSPEIFVNGTLKTLGTDYSISSTGVVTFTSAPGNGDAITWTGSFYFACRFAADTADAVRSFTTNSGTDLWDIESIKFSSEFVATSSYGVIGS